MAGLLSGLFGGAKPPPPINVDATAAKADAANKGTATWNADQYHSQGSQGPTGGMHWDPASNSYVRTFDPSLQGGFDNLTGGFNATTGGMPTSFNFDSTTAPAILNSGMQTYDALAADPIKQGQNRLSTQLSERGIPLGSEIDQTEQGNFDRQNALARQSAFSTLYGQLPGMQGQLNQNEITKGMAPGQLAGQGLGLIGGMQGLLPNYANPYQYNAQAPNIEGLTQANYSGQMDAYKAQQQSNAGLMGALGTFGGLALGGPMGASLGRGLMGGVGNLFNSRAPGDTSGN